MIKINLAKERMRWSSVVRLHLTNRRMVAQFNRVSGFTLVELMLVLTIVAIFMAIAIPGYQVYARRANAAVAQQEIQKLAEQLERHKSRNFSYKGFNAQYLYNATGTAPFNATDQTLTLPLNATGTNIRYTLSIVDNSVTGNPLLTASTAIGQSWAIKAVSNDIQNFSFLMTSSGLRCQNKTIANMTYATCGTGGEAW